jgi:hypothetical protein
VEHMCPKRLGNEQQPKNFEPGSTTSYSRSRIIYMAGAVAYVILVLENSTQNDFDFAGEHSIHKSDKH